MKINLFGWEFVIMRYRPNKSSLGASGIHPDGIYIKKEEQYLVACDKDGKFIPRQISLTLDDTVNEPSTVTVKYYFAGFIKEP